MEGSLAHHLAIVGQNVDLQLWIQRDGRPLHLKLVVTYKDVPMAPQYQAVLMDWELDAKVATESFQPHLPQGAREVELIVMEGRQ